MALERATSFGTAAAAYVAARPTYPQVSVRDLLGSEPRDVVDLGAGTGKLTQTLVAAGHRVHAVDPDPAMLAALAEAVPGVPYAIGSASEIPLPDASADAVLAGQAYHWFDAGTALPEIARVLRPGGILGLLWNVRDDRVPWVAAFGQLVGTADAGDADLRPDLPPLFTAASVRWYEHRHVLTVDGLVDLAASRSYVIARPTDERAVLLEEVRALGREVADPDGTIRVPYRLQVWSGEKVGR